MKKTKLLMPLMGLTVLGAVAPVMTITSCNKGEAALIDSAVAGNLYDPTKMLMTNRIGQENLNVGDDQPVNNLKLMLHLPNAIPENQTLIMTIDTQGYGSSQPTEKQTPFVTHYLGPDQITTSKYQNWITIDFTEPQYTNTIAVNRAKINSLAAGEEASFTFDIKFTLKDNETGKDVKTQIVPITLVACPSQHDIPVLKPIASDNLKATTSGTQVNFTGLKFYNMPNELPSNLELSFKNHNYIWMNQESYYANDDKTIAINTYNPILISDENITFSGWLEDGQFTGGAENFDYWFDIHLDFVCKLSTEQETQFFVLPEWQCTGTITHTYGEHWQVNA